MFVCYTVQSVTARSLSQDTSANFVGTTGIVGIVGGVLFVIASVAVIAGCAACRYDLPCSFSHFSDIRLSDPIVIKLVCILYSLTYATIDTRSLNPYTPWSIKIFTTYFFKLDLVCRKPEV